MARLASATVGRPSCAVGIDNPAAEQSGNGTVVAGGPVDGLGHRGRCWDGIVVGMEPLAGAESSGFEIIGRTPRVKITTPKAAAKISQPRGGRGAHHSREGRHGVLGGLAHLLGGLFHPLLEFVEMLHVVSSCLQASAEMCPRLVQVGLHRPGAHTHDLADLGDRELVDVVQDGLRLSSR